MTSVVRPRRRVRSPSKTSASETLSSAEVGSSRSRIGAFFRKARAIASRWRCCYHDLGDTSDPGGLGLVIRRITHELHSRQDPEHDTETQE